ncbi:hypothetical protein STCU_10648 [Strigomonas culicis]|uniref:Uncharacterized protein n=1 Tax=Strigomonas culicis TaxID=28005 RepID=S9TM08_9TRYP|nr:hypothetical protein STCU_10648 [Strigomonas culicis]|eukprot:EPY17398.1 hypothetical protein STCU_10648 [Strigomonas culicis]
MPYLHRRGLSRKVLHSMCGGETGLPRYSIGAYFDSRRSGDTGEALPDNVFDLLPARMHFLHGGRDTTSPLAESATLVATLRNAQQRFALRRLMCQEERSRHAFATQRPDAVSVLGVHDGPLPPVDIQFIVIPDGNHTDAIVEECIAGSRSCCVDFVCDWEPEQRREASESAIASAADRCNARGSRRAPARRCPTVCSHWRSPHVSGLGSCVLLDSYVPFRVESFLLFRLFSFLLLWLLTLSLYELYSFINAHVRLLFGFVHLPWGCKTRKHQKKKEKKSDVR